MDYEAQHTRASRAPAYPPLKRRIGRMLMRRKRQVRQHEFASVWQIVGLVQDEDWSVPFVTDSAFVFLYVVELNEFGLDTQYPNDPVLRVLAIRPPFPQCPSIVEQHRLGASLREYLNTQLAASHLVRHFVVVFKQQTMRIPWRWKDSSVLGRGQYLAVINAATQVNGLTPLEVRLIQSEQKIQREPTGAATGRACESPISLAPRFSHYGDASHLVHQPYATTASRLASPVPVSLSQHGARVGSFRRSMTNPIL